MASGHCLCGPATFEITGDSHCVSHWRRPDELDRYLDASGKPRAFEPQDHAFLEERIPCLDTRDAMPRK